MWYIAGSVLLVATNWLSTTIPLYLAQGIDGLALGAEGQAIVLRSALTIAAMGAGVIVVRTGSRLLFFTPGRLVEARVKADLFASLLRHQPSFLTQWPTGDLVSRASSDVTTTRLLAGFASLGVINTAVALVLTLVQMTRISPELTLVVVLPVTLAFAVTLGFVGRLFTILRRLQAQTADLSTQILSTYQGIATVHAFNAEECFQEQLEHHNEAYLKTSLERAQMRTVIGPLLVLASSASVFLLLYVGGPLAIQGEITIGELIAFTTLIAYLTGPLRGMSFILSLVKRSQASLERIDAICAPKPDRPDLPNPSAPPEAAPAFEIRDLSFAYPGAEEQALKNLSFTIPAGSTLGVFGHTASGKTTLLAVLSRLYNPPAGTLYVDGVDLRDIDLDAWRETATLVAQRAFLFSESIEDNILLGEADGEKLERMLSLAALEQDIQAMPEGVKTIVGEAGMRLSGGQRQRVAIARGLARDKTVLLLDDVLSAVDHSTEAQLLQGLRKQRSATTVIVAHRISALMDADNILVLENGEQRDMGTHEELINRDGPYRMAWQLQQEELV